VKLLPAGILVFAFVVYYWIAEGRSDEQQMPASTFSAQEGDGKGEKTATPLFRSKQEARSVSKSFGDKERDSAGYGIKTPAAKKMSAAEQGSAEVLTIEKGDVGVSEDQEVDLQEQEAIAGDEVGAKGPTAPRAHLIGGANVEWIPPKPKDPGDKFGEPPI